MEGGGALRTWTVCALAVAGIFALLGALAVAGAVHAEDGAPALEGDGVWRARSNWTVQAAETVEHEGRTIEVFGNLTVKDEADLTLRNVTLRFPAATQPNHLLTVGSKAHLVLTNVTVSMEGPLDRFVVNRAAFDGTQCVFTFAHNATYTPPAAGVAYAIEGYNSPLNFTDCIVRTDAPFAVRMYSGALRTTDCDFLTVEGAGADIVVDQPATASLDTTRWGTLVANSGPEVEAFATVRFFLFDRGGQPQAGRVNGTGPLGEVFDVSTAPNATAAIRLKWFGYADAPERLTPDDRAAFAPFPFTAATMGVGANNSAARLNAHRVNVTVVLTGTFDIAVVSFTMNEVAESGPPLKRAYYVKLNESQALLLRVENRGVGPSPAVTLNLTHTALTADAWAPTAVLKVEPVALPPLLPGESANVSLPFIPGKDGGFKDDSGPCFFSHSYVSSLTLSLGDHTDEDFASWNNARSLKVVAYEVEGDPAAACESKGEDVLPYLALGAVGAVVAVAAMTFYFSDGQVARRAARPPRNGKGKPPAP